MDKNHPLAGRKRTRELADSNTLPDKISELKHLQEEQAQSAQPEFILTPTTAVPTRSAETSVSQVAQKLVELHEQWRSAGSRQYCEYTPAMRSELMMKAIREELRKKHRLGERQGLSPENNARDCQEFVDQLRRLLKQQGIIVNPLKVTA